MEGADCASTAGTRPSEPAPAVADTLGQPPLPSCIAHTATNIEDAAATTTIPLAAPRAQVCLLQALLLSLAMIFRCTAAAAAVAVAVAAAAAAA
eukprot:479848-Alexandrium_andersonii.AAC.1